MHMPKSFSTIRPVLLKPRLAQVIARDGPPSVQTKTVSVMRLVPHSLTIILSKPLLKSSNRHIPSGLLVSSFNTVTLTPTPFVSFNIKLPSSTYDTIISSGKFTASGINSCELAKKFLLPDGPKKALFIEACTRKDDKADQGPWLKDCGQGAVWWMDCEWIRESSMTLGDHVVVIGKVIDAGKYVTRNERKGTVYMDGEYRNFPNEIMSNERQYMTNVDIRSDEEKTSQKGIDDEGLRVRRVFLSSYKNSMNKTGNNERQDTTNVDIRSDEEKTSQKEIDDEGLRVRRVFISSYKNSMNQTGENERQDTTNVDIHSNGGEILQGRIKIRYHNAD